MGFTLEPPTSQLGVYNFFYSMGSLMSSTFPKIILFKHLRRGYFGIAVALGLPSSAEKVPMTLGLVVQCKGPRL